MKTTKIMAVLLAFMMCFSIVSPAFAASEEAVIKVTVDNPTPAIGDIITVTVAFEKCPANIYAMEILVPIDTGAFTTVGEAPNYCLPKNDTTSGGSVFQSNGKGAFVNWIDGYKPLSSSSTTIMTFQLKVKSSGIISIDEDDSYSWLYDEITKKDIPWKATAATVEPTATPGTGTINGLKYSIIDNSYAKITGYTGSATELVIPAKVNNVPVQSIGSWAFQNCDYITSIELPDSVTSIGNYAFNGCDSLTSIEIPNSVASIGECAFGDCDSLTSVTLGNSVTSIGIDAFGYCKSLTSIEVAEDNTTYCDVDGVLFNKDKTILIQYPMGKTASSYTIPDSVTSIGTGAFFLCDSLTSVTLGNSVKSIGDNAFCFCDSLTSIEIPDSVTSIGYAAFLSCDSLTSIEIPDSVTSIGDDAFCDCDSLTSIEIPDSVTSIGDDAFYDCDNLTIYGESGSYAETYANENWIPFVAGITASLRKITFTYQSGKDYTATCYYTDDYFSRTSYDYNPSLATMSISLAMSAFGSSKGGQKDYTNKSANAKKLLMDIGIDEKIIKTNDWFTEKPTTDSIGVIVGNKPITVNGKKYTLIALAVRGGGYEAEWASNFTIGSSNHHNGFDTAKQNVINYLKSYVADQNITGAVKLWITGYSRAAAVANLVGGAIKDGVVISDDISYEFGDVYTYCFEAPAGVLKSKIDSSKYTNIFNIINSSDPVPYVAPKAMGFVRYGIDLILPSKESNPKRYKEAKGKMEKIYNSLDSVGKYEVDDFVMKKLKPYIESYPGGLGIRGVTVKVADDTKSNYSQGLFLANYINILAKEFIESRDNYVTNYQDEIREVCSVVFSCTKEQSEKMMDSVVSQAKEEWSSALWSYLWNCGIDPWGTEEEALQVISDWLKKAIKDAGITGYDEATIDSAGKKLADLLLAVGSNHPNYALTAIMNIKGLGAAHYPELCYSWLASMDKNYSDDAKVMFNNGGFRIVRINCDVDVEVKGDDGEVVASIENEEPVVLTDSSYIYGVDEDGQKYVVLPIDADYDVSIKGREDDLVSYSISEYCASTGEFTRNVSYFNVDLKQGEELKGTIPSYSEDEIENDIPEGSNVRYDLIDPDNKTIESDSDKSGSEASQNFFNVKVTSSNIQHGAVGGSGVQQYGTFAQVEAVASEGCKFMGWYRDGNFVSADAVYRVCVIEDIELVAKFVQERVYKETEDGLGYYIIDDSYIEIAKYVGPSTSFVIPSEIDGYSVKTIGESAFYCCVELESIKIPDGVTEIGDYGFFGCESLKNVEIPDSVATIGDYSFAYCDLLGSIEIPNSLTSMGYGAFANCRTLKSVVIPGSIANISDNMFMFCDSLAQVTISNGVKTIGDYAFFACRALTSITIPDTVTDIGDAGFYGCKKMSALTIGNGVKTIGAYAFKCCEALTSVTIPDSVTTIGTEAFEECTSLQKITIPSSVVNIKKDAFADCGNLTIYGESGSYAEKYAKGAGIVFNSGEEPESTPSASMSMLIPIPESGYILDTQSGILRGILEETSLDTLLANFEEGNLTVTKANGEEVTDKEALVGTGYIITLLDKGRSVAESVTIVVSGDVNGDGKINSKDISEVQKYIFEMANPAGAYLLACDMTADGKTNSRDIAQIQRKLLA